MPEESGRGLWPRAETLQLLREWRRAANAARAQQPNKPTSTKNGPVEDAVLRTACRSFLALPTAPNRSADAVGRFLHRLKRVARVALAYNARKRRVQSACASPWLALSAAQQLREFETQHASAGFVPLDAELFKVLEAVMTVKSEQQQAKKGKQQTRVVPDRAIRGSSNSSSECRKERGRLTPWTKSDVCMLLAAWRHVLERGGSAMASQQGPARAVFTRFCALAKSGTPARSESAVKYKMGNLAQLYRLVESFNVRGEGGRPGASKIVGGSHESEEWEEEDVDYDARQRVTRADWFTASSSERAQHLIEWSQKVSNVTDFDRDMFNAMKVIMTHGAASGPRVRGVGSVAIIDVEESDEMEEGEGGDDNGRDWGARTAFSSVPTDTVSQRVALSPESNYQWETVYHPSAWDTTNKRESPPERAIYPTYWAESSAPQTRSLKHMRRTAPAVSVSRFPCAAPAISGTAADSDSEDDDRTQSERSALNYVTLESASVAVAPPPQLSEQQTQRFLDILAQLKKERETDRAKRRKERAERRELTALISEERKQRRMDKKDRRRERREWELERDRLRFELKRMREKYKSVRRKLRAL